MDSKYYAIYPARGGVAPGSPPWNTPTNHVYVHGVHPHDLPAGQIQIANNLQPNGQVGPGAYVSAIGPANDASGTTRGTFISLYAAIPGGWVRMYQKDRNGNSMGPVCLMSYDTVPWNPGVGRLHAGTLAVEVEGETLELTLPGELKEDEVSKDEADAMSVKN